MTFINGDIVLIDVAASLIDGVVVMIDWVMSF